MRLYSLKLRIAISLYTTQNYRDHNSFLETRYIISRALHLSSNNDVQIINFKAFDEIKKDNSCFLLTISRASYATTKSNFSLFVDKFIARF